MRRSALIGLISVPLMAALYLGIGAAILRYGLDDHLWPRIVASEPLPQPTYSSLADGMGSIVRAVGPDTGRCVVFFPGHSGSFLRYAHDLFPSLNAWGFKHTVFLGRSLGASIAAVAATQWRPRGLVLEGAGASLAAVARRELARHWYSKMLEVLPVEALVSPDFPLAISVAHFGPRRTSLFQGQLDDMASLTELAQLERMGVKVQRVPGATHTDAYRLAGPMLYAAIAQMSNASEDAVPSR